MYTYPSLSVNSAVLYSCFISSGGIKSLWILMYSGDNNCIVYFDIKLMSKVIMSYLSYRLVNWAIPITH